MTLISGAGASERDYLSVGNDRLCVRPERGISEKTSEDGESTIISTRQSPAGSDAADCIKYLEANGPSRTQELAGFIRAVHILAVGVPASERCVPKGSGQEHIFVRKRRGGTILECSRMLSCTSP